MYSRPVVVGWALRTCHPGHRMPTQPPVKTHAILSLPMGQLGPVVSGDLMGTLGLWTVGNPL